MPIVLHNEVAPTDVFELPQDIVDSLEAHEIGLAAEINIDLGERVDLTTVDVQLFKDTLTAETAKIDGQIQAAKEHLGDPIEKALEPGQLKGPSEDEQIIGAEARPKMPPLLQQMIKTVKSELSASGLAPTLISEEEIEAHYWDLAVHLKNELSDKADLMHRLFEEAFTDEELLLHEVSDKHIESIDIDVTEKLRTLGRVVVGGRWKQRFGDAGMTNEKWVASARRYVNTYKPRAQADIAADYIKSGLFYYGEQVFGSQPVSFVQPNPSSPEDLDKFKARYDLPLTKPLSPRQWLDQRLQYLTAHALYAPDSRWAQTINQAVETPGDSRFNYREEARQGRVKNFAERKWGFKVSEDPAERTVYGHDPKSSAEPPQRPAFTQTELNIIDEFGRNIDALKLDETLRRAKAAFTDEFRTRLKDRAVTEGEDTEGVIKAVLKGIMTSNHPDKTKAGQTVNEDLYLIAENIRANLARHN